MFLVTFFLPRYKAKIVKNDTRKEKHGLESGIVVSFVSLNEFWGVRSLTSRSTMWMSCFVGFIFSVDDFKDVFVI